MGKEKIREAMPDEVMVMLVEVQHIVARRLPVKIIGPIFMLLQAGLRLGHLIQLSWVPLLSMTI